MTEIVVLDGYTLNPGDNPWTDLEALGRLTVYDRTPTEAVVERASKAEIVLTNKVVFDAAVLQGLPRLKGICVLATGVNVVDLEAARARGIVVCNVPSYGTMSVAQHAFALLLELTNHVGLHDSAVRAGKWAASPDFCFSERPLEELDGKIFGVVGFGRIGRKVAEIARAFGMHVWASPARSPQRDPVWLRRLPLDELFTGADVVSLHCTLVPETAELVRRERLELMKPNALLLNTGRGGLVREADLAEALNTGRIAGAALDVLSTEPPQANNPLLHVRNCIITPHVAWLSLAARRRVMAISVENVRGILSGHPRNVVSAR
jgi:glycerate dehydrogenase